MCEETYSGCPKCKAETSELRWHTTGSSGMTYRVDADGDPDELIEWDTPEDEGCGGSLYCTACGESEFEIEHDIVPAECSCEECEPTVFDDDDLVLLKRIAYPVTGVLPLDTPEELRTLLTKRSIIRLPIRRERGEEVLYWLASFPTNFPINGTEPTEWFELINNAPQPHEMRLLIPEPSKASTTRNELEVAA